MKILQKNNKKLRQRSEEATVFDIELSRLAARMLSVVRKESAAGLAAPQIGENIRMVIVRINSLPRVMVNPLITWMSEATNIETEKCLSIRNANGKLIPCDVKRSDGVVVEYFNLDGTLCRVNINAPITARIIQHEIDHLNGTLMTDRAL